MKKKYERPRIIDFDKDLDIGFAKNNTLCNTGNSARRGNCRIGPSTFF
jgi:hypothetical protein